MKPNKKLILALTIILSVLFIVCIFLIIFGVLFCAGFFDDAGEGMLVPGLPMIVGAAMLMIFSSSLLAVLRRARRVGKTNPNKTFFNTTQTIEEAQDKEYYGGSVNDQLSGKYRGNLRCPKCGARRSGHARYCEYCGEPFEPTEKDNRGNPYGN